MDIKDAIMSNGIDPPREVDQLLVRKSEGFLVCSMAISRPGSVATIFFHVFGVTAGEVQLDFLELF